MVLALPFLEVWLLLQGCIKHIHFRNGQIWILLSISSLNNSFFLYYGVQSISGDYFFPSWSNFFLMHCLSKAFKTYSCASCYAYLFYLQREITLQFYFVFAWGLYIILLFVIFCCRTSSFKQNSSEIFNRYVLSLFIYLSVIFTDRGEKLISFFRGKWNLFSFYCRSRKVLFCIFWAFTCIHLIFFFCVFSCSTSSFKQNSSRVFDRYYLFLSFTHGGQ